MSIIFLSVSFACAILLCFSFGAKRTQRTQSRPQPKAPIEPMVPVVPLLPWRANEQAKETDPLKAGWSYSSKDEALLHYDMALHASKYGHFAQVRRRLKLTFSINPQFRKIALAEPALADFWAKQSTGGI